MQGIDIRKLAECLNVPYEVAAQIASAAQRSPAVPPSEVVTKIRFHLMPGASLRAQPSEKGASGRDDRFAGLLAKLSPEIRKHLLKVEPKVLGWINESRDNAALFATDPIGVLRSLGVDSKIVEELAAIRRSSAAQQYGVPGIRIESIEVDANPKDAGRPGRRV
jgi:hypothetical protein